MKQMHPFPMEDGSNLVKSSSTTLKKGNEPISTKFGKKHPWVKGIQVLLNEVLRPFFKGR